MNEIVEKHLKERVELQAILEILMADGHKARHIAEELIERGYRKPVKLTKLSDHHIFEAAIDCPQVNAYGHMDADIFSMCYAVAKAQLAHNQQEMEAHHDA
jgi:uncharacterized membrane-anchored protein